MAAIKLLHRLSGMMLFSESSFFLPHHRASGGAFAMTICDDLGDILFVRDLFDENGINGGVNINIGIGAC